MAAKGWGKSKVTRESLPPYVAAGIIPEFKQERWRVPAANEVEPLPRPGEFVIFLSFLDRGFALPTSDFLRQLLAFYNIKISDLGPHSVQQISLFVALCQCYPGCPPYFPLWVMIFHGRATRVSKSDQSLIPNGGITFQVKSGGSFIDMAPPKKAQSQWCRFWFYAMEYTPPGGLRIPQYTPEPSIPRRLNVRSLPRDQEEVVREMRLAIQALKNGGLTAANMYNCWLGRRLIRLRCRGHFMWEYRGHNDITRSTATEWDEAEYRKALAKVTTASFTSFDDGLQPLIRGGPIFSRWQKVADHLPPLAGKEPPEMTEGEEDEAEDEGERTESDSDTRDFIRLPRVAKRGANSSSQGAPGEDAPEDEEGEETTSPPEGKGPAKRTDEPRSKRLRQTILEGATELRRPLKYALEAGARVGPGVKAIPTVKSKKKVLTRPAPVGGAAATRAAEAKKAAELKKAAESKKVAADPASLVSSREEPAVVRKAMGATASSVGPIAGGSPSASASSGEVTKAGVESTMARGPDIVPPMVEEETAGTESATARSPDAISPVVEKEQGAAEGSGLSAKMRERRTKAARDQARRSVPEAPAEETQSTEAVVQGSGTHESRRPPLSTLSFTELHAALGEVHVAEVKRLTALVEEAAKKNRQLVAIGKAREKALAEAREGYVKESFYRDAEFRAKTAEEATKRAKTELPDLNKVLEGKGKELEDVIAEYKGKLEAAADARDTARGAAATRREEVAALKLQHAKELAAEKEASEVTVLAVQAEKTSFEAFVREMSRQLLGQCEFVETATPRECLEAATTRIIAYTGEILAALQYLSPREVILRDAPSVFKAVSDIPAVVDWLRRSSCRVGVTVALSMVLAHYSEGFDVEEVTVDFPSETGEFDVAEVLRLMESVRPYADRVLATVDLETHIVSQLAPEDAEKEAGPKDFPAERLFHAAATNTLSTYPVVTYTPRFLHGEGGAETVIEEKPGSSK
ncbi:hypothetical protein QYE76_030197 [Lolium multiflorum]|uniref:Transposase (putative) gypsy type domain-containing protein n=1 Tax=Lolium multiflorum TaxID=4521 RepID=A0AAD8QSM9_LOLMU|nr:hypothetical protein QYE76_030197 [Lolium multiflorum]